VVTKKGKCYYVTFIDDFSCWTHVDFLTNKSEVTQSYKDFDMGIKTQFRTCIKALHSDQGGEYMVNKLQSYLKSCSTKQKLTVHDTPQHNGIAEW
jgi:hypothetical protein